MIKMPSAATNLTELHYDVGELETLQADCEIIEAKAALSWNRAIVLVQFSVKILLS